MQPILSTATACLLFTDFLVSNQRRAWFLRNRNNEALLHQFAARFFDARFRIVVFYLVARVGFLFLELELCGNKGAVRSPKCLNQAARFFRVASRKLAFRAVGAREKFWAFYQPTI